MVSLIKYGTLGGGEKYETNVMTFDGLSSDDLPVGTFEGMAIPNGSSYFETDTGIKYLYDEENKEWYEQPSSGGGGGGGGSDNYNDLSNKPQIAGVTLSGNKSLSALGIASATDIPTVNDSTITIQKNGVAVDTFTTNTASAKTIDITVPTSASDVSALPASTKYAGASTAGGAATSAAKLNTNAGSETQPVYFSDGVPVAGTYSLNKTVPADAVFTDTTYESKSAASGGTEVSLVTTGEKYTWNTVTDKVDKETGKGLSTNDYTTEEKNKLSGLTQYTDALASAAIYGLGTEMTKNTSFDSYTTSGAYYAYNAVASTLTGGPVSIGNNHVRLEVVNVGSSIQQRLFIASNLYDDKFYIRRKASGGTWGSWYVHTGAVVT